MLRAFGPPSQGTYQPAPSCGCGRMIGVTSSSSGALPSETDWKERQQSSKGYQLLDVNHWDTGGAGVEHFKRTLEHILRKVHRWRAYISSWDLWRTILEIQISWHGWQAFKLCRYEKAVGRMDGPTSWVRFDASTGFNQGHSSFRHVTFYPVVH